MPVLVLALVAGFGLSTSTAAQDLGGCSGPPQPEQEPNDTPATATLLAPGQGVYDYMARSPSAIAIPGDVDYFRVDAAPGTRLSVLVDTAVLPQSPGSMTRDSVVQVLASDGVTVLETDDDDGTGLGKVVSGEASTVVGLPVSGTIYIRVAAKSPSLVLAPYLLWVSARTHAFVPEIEPNDTLLTSMAINDNPVLADLAGPSDLDWYYRRFLGGGGHAILVDGDPERDGTVTDVRIDFDGGPHPTIDSSIGIGDPPPGAEAAWSASFVWGQRFRVSSGSGVGGSYSVRLAYIGGDGCQVPVELQTFEVR